MATIDQKRLFIEQFRTGLTDLLRDIETIRALNRKWVGLNLENDLADADFTGTSLGLDAEGFNNAMLAVSGVVSSLPQGLDTIVYKIAY